MKDLAFRFGISTTSASRYITTWICFLYHHLKELDWTPTVQQVIGTLPHSFQKSYPDTYAIIDGSEIFRVYYEENNIDRIVTYCQKDTIAVAQIILRLRGEALLETDEIAYI